MTKLPSERVEELSDTVRDSIYADDRQTSRELDAGLAALRQLVDDITRLEAENADLMMHYGRSAK